MLCRLLPLALHSSAAVGFLILIIAAAGVWGIHGTHPYAPPQQGFCTYLLEKLPHRMRLTQSWSTSFARYIASV